MPNVTAEQAREAIRMIFKEWTDAVGAVKDYTFLDRHLDDSWRYTDFNGTQRGKDEYRKLVDSIVWYTQDMRQLDARIVGEDIAIVTGIYHSRAEVKGGVKLANTIIFSGVWELQDHVWKSLLHHTTRMADAP